MRKYTTTENGLDRRTFISGAAGVIGTVALAGCTGGNDEEGTNDTETSETATAESSGKTNLVLTTATETTAAYAGSQGIAAAVNQNSDSVYVDARPSKGTNANVGMLERDEIQLGYIQNWTAQKLANGKKPFNNLSFTPNQVFHYYDLPWLLTTANADWKTLTNVTEDSRVSPTPRGSGTAEMLEHALGRVTEDYDRVSIDYGSQASAMSEGRLDVGAITLLNFDIEPGWVEQMKSTVDLRILEWPDDAVSQLEDDPSVLMREVDMTKFDGYASAPDTARAPTLSYNFICRNDLEYDAVYDMLSTMHEQRSGMGEYHVLLKKFEEGSFWVQNAYDMPFHPAAADFYEEIGVWRDEFTRGTET